MGKFKVGHRVRVDAPVEGFMFRVESYEGDSGTVIATHEDDCEVRIDRDGQTWSFGDVELSLLDLADIAFSPESPTLLDQFAMAALTGLLSNPVEVPGLKSVGDVQKRYAELSFGYAQAMMKAREVQK